MQADTSIVRRRLIILGVLCFVVLPLCVMFYSSRSNSFAAAQTSGNTVTFTDPTPLQNVVPDKSYQYTIDRLNDYINASSAEVTSMTIDSPVKVDSGAYTFQVGFHPGDQTHVVSVRVINYDGVISTAVYVDNLVQRVTAPTNSSKGTTYTGFDGLTDVGLSSYQVQALQQAFAKFNTSSNVAIDTSSVATSTDPNISSYTFTVTVGDTAYNATVTGVGLTAVRLQLADQNGKQVFDSGTVTYSN